MAEGYISAGAMVTFVSTSPKEIAAEGSRHVSIQTNNSIQLEERKRRLHVTVSFEGVAWKEGASDVYRSLESELRPIARLCGRDREMNGEGVKENECEMDARVDCK
ncbi:unnamed protein product [Allacma fusca]|uniref:Uncharacterized protein n=1 Tax=Allacma fusca TaxID=39272 RepID=A0A8J2L4U5_9HEXA|nr:unnamed protein product [Allacma fusca]